MGIGRGNKINKLFVQWPDGVIHTTPWLKARGYTDQNLQKYRSSRWIEAIGIGAYKKCDDVVDWMGGLQAIQNELGLRIHVGGKSALALLGRAHYLELGERSIQLMGAKASGLPTWFKSHSWTVKVHYTQKNLFEQTAAQFGTKSAGYTTKTAGKISFVLSGIERALLEYLDGVPGHATYDEACKLLEGMPDLRAGVLQGLLESCSSVKVKRLFLHLGERASHPWFKKLKMATIDLGSGKRVVFKGGTLDSKYLITVPKG